MTAKLIDTRYVKDRFKSVAVCRYEYRGHEYFIEYDKRNIKPSHIYAQDHRSEQIHIDRIIEAESRPKFKGETADESLKAFFEAVGEI